MRGWADAAMVVAILFMAGMVLWVAAMLFVAAADAVQDFAAWLSTWSAW